MRMRRAQVAPDARAHSPRTDGRGRAGELRRKLSTRIVVVGQLHCWWFPFAFGVRRPRNPRPFSRPSSTLTLMTIPIRRDPTHRKMDLGRNSQSMIHQNISKCTLGSMTKSCNAYGGNPRANCQSDRDLGPLSSAAASARSSARWTRFIGCGRHSCDGHHERGRERTQRRGRGNALAR